MGCRLQGIHVLMLDNGGIVQIHAKRVSEPTKALLDVVGRFSGFVEWHASPNAQRMGRIPFDIFWGCVGTNSLDRSSKELGCFASREVEMFALFSFVHGKGQIVRLL